MMLPGGFVIGFRLLRQAWLVAALLFAASLPRDAVAQGALPSAVMFGRVPHDGAIAADPVAASAAQCSTDAALLGGPALRSASRPGLRMTSTIAAAIALPSCVHHRLALDAIAALQPGIGPLHVNEYLTGAALSLPLEPVGVWIAYRSSATRGESPAAYDSGRSEGATVTMSRAPLAELSAGASRRLGPIYLELSAGAAHGIVRSDVVTSGRIVTDSVWTDTLGWLPESHEVAGGRVTSAVGAHWLTSELHASWTHARFAAGASIGGWFAGARMPGVGFGSIELSTRVMPNVWIIGGAGVAPDLTRPVRAPGRFATLGLRFAYMSRTGFTGSTGATSARAFTVAPVDSSSYIFSLRVPGAERVEMSGEFTGWKPVALVRSAEGLWAVRLAVAPGAYRVNVRVDGGRWQAPPGTTAVADDFGGSAGLVVVPAR
jgi:hypothetical protein